LGFFMVHSIFPLMEWTHDFFGFMLKVLNEC
jgi:hypothetical protein